MFKRLAVLALVVTVWTAGRLPADVLSIGDAAPKLQVKEFVKGEPVTGFEKGKIYVVEFWATWCGPCKVSIPHLTELQKKYKDVVFIGVSVYEQDAGAVKPFVKEMGDKMDYRVALDDVPMNQKAADGRMAKGWMDASNQEGIPTAFIIDKDSRVAWIGHPMQMEKPFEEIVSGKYDIKAAAAKFKEEQSVKVKMREYVQRLTKAQQSGDMKKVVAVLDDAFKEEPKLEQQWGMPKFQILYNQLNDRDQALTYGKHLVDTVFKENAAQLNNLAWPLVDPEAKKEADEAFKKLALAAAKRADELMSGKDAAIMDTLARAYFVNGDKAKALEIQEKAVAKAKGTAQEAELKGRLEEYRKAAKQ